MRLRAIAAALVAGTIVVTTFVASGSAHGSSSAVMGKRVNPCSVLDSAVIGETLGGDASSATRAGRELCRWFVTGAVADKTERTVVLVSVERYRGRAKRDIGENVDEPSAVSVAGLSGAKIAYYDLEVVPPTFTAVTGKRLFVVQMNALDDEDATVDALTTLAEAVLANLSSPSL
ncbi:MAG TPA: hypothetical protein VMX12_09220 [Acidimicrobiia bacterium]|nr:hypothetical protein [Acidimicrobiia bacterium]